MFQSIVFNYSRNSLVIHEQAANANFIKDQVNPASVAYLKKINDFILSSTLLAGSYELEIKITPKGKQPEIDDCIFQIWEGFYKRNPDLLSILRFLAEKRIFPEAAALEKLSVMERKIVLLIRDGLSYTEIANKLHISPHTVNGHRKNAIKVLGVSKILGLVALLNRFELD